ncbi:hypothetical protein D3C80_2046550 [compost metagenome]
MTSKPSAVSSFSDRSVSSMSGNRVLGSDRTSSLTRVQPPASRARRRVRTASSPVKQPAVFGR